MTRAAPLLLLLAGCVSDSPGVVDGKPGDGEGADSGSDGARPTGFIWTFDDAGEELHEALDTSGNGLGGLAEGALATGPGVRFGRVAVRFAGDGVGVVLDEDAAREVSDLDAGEPLRLQIALRTEHHGTGHEGALVSRGDGGDGWSLGIRDGRPVFTLRSGGPSAEVQLDRTVSDGRWHRLTAGREVDGTLVLGADGVEIGRSAPGLTGAVQATGLLRLGDLRADVDELRLDRRPPSLPESTVERDVIEVYRKGEAPEGGEPAQYDTVRIPALLQAPGGTLLAFAEGRVNNACDFGDVDALVKRSVDGGRTWSAAQVVVNAGTDRVGNPVPVADVRSGFVHLLTTTYALDPETCGASDDTCDCTAVSGPPLIEVRTSADDGLTWGEPRDVTADVFAGDWSSVTLGPGHGLQRADGTLVVAAAHRLADDGSRGGHLLVSADGTAWSIGASETASDVNVNESSVAELPDRSLVVTTRNQYGSSDVTWDLREAGLRGQAHLDDALAWATTPAYTLRPELRGPVVHASILQLSGGEALGQDALTVLSFPAGEHGSNYGQRHDLRLWSSEDGAASWREGARIQAGWAAYSDLAPLAEAGLGVLVESAATTDDDVTYYDRIDLLRLARQPLDDLTLVAWTFEGDDPALAAGPAALRLEAPLAPTAGEHESSALRFEGEGPVCAAADAAAGWLDFGVRDGFVVEATFRTEDHAEGGSTASGALVTRTSTHTAPAWWLRVEDGRLRFLVGACEADEVNCGVVPGACADLTECVEGDVWSDVSVSDGQWHHVAAGRDGLTGRLFLVVDGGPAQVETFDVHGIVKNEEPLCLGAFADGARAFRGEIDAAAVRILDPASAP